MRPLRRVLALIVPFLALALSLAGAPACAGADPGQEEEAQQPIPRSDAPGGPANLLARAWGAVPVDRLLGGRAAAGRPSSLQGPGLGADAHHHGGRDRPPPPGAAALPATAVAATPGPGIVTSAALQAGLARAAGGGGVAPTPQTPPQAVRRQPPALLALEGRLPGVGGAEPAAAPPADDVKAPAPAAAWEEGAAATGNWSAYSLTADPLFDPYGAAAAWEDAGEDVLYDDEAAMYDEDGLYDGDDDDFWDALYDDEAEMDAVRPPGGGGVEGDFRDEL